MFDGTICEGLDDFTAEGPDNVNSTTRCRPGLIPDEEPAPPPSAGGSSEVADKGVDAPDAATTSLASATVVLAAVVMLGASLFVLL